MNIEELEQQYMGARKKKRGAVMVALVLLLALLVAGGIWTFMLTRQQSKYDVDRNALAGFLPGHTQEEIEAELNRIIDEGRFAVSINPSPVVSGGKVNLMLENVPANHYLMQVDVYLTQEDGTEQMLYRSGLIQQGYYIETVEAAFAPKAGEYNGRAVFRALMPDGNNEEIGQTEATLLIFVEDAG